jgi:hypothetical protein
MGWIAAVGARGQLVAPPPPPGGGETYGPTAGRAAIIAAAKPRTVTDPGGGITFTTRADLQTKITANASGTKFIHAAGGTVDWDANIDVGNKAPKIYYLGLAGSTSTVINGGARDIFGLTGTNGLGGAAGTGFEVHGGRWTNFGGTSDATGPMNTQDGVIVEDAQFDGNRASGFRCVSTNGIYRYIKTFNNGRDGWTLAEYTNDGPIRVGNLFERIESANNNTRLFNPGIHAGGCKMLQCRSTTTRYVYCHDNLGFGLWYDLNNDVGGSLTNNTFEECVCEDNARSGIFYESGYSGPFIHRNIITNNGNSDTIGGQAPGYINCTGMRITNSDCSIGGTGRGKVSFNIFDYTGAQDGNVGGLIVFANHDGQARSCHQWDVTNNQWWLRSATAQSNRRVTMQDTKTSGTPLMGDADIQWSGNQHHVASLATEYWQECDPGTRTEDGNTWAEWIAAGRDTNGARIQI